jgi:hypothetical protein
MLSTVPRSAGACDRAACARRGVTCPQLLQPCCFLGPCGDCSLAKAALQQPHLHEALRRRPVHPWALHAGPPRGRRAWRRERGRPLPGLGSVSGAERGVRARETHSRADSRRIAAIPGSPASCLGLAVQSGGSSGGGIFVPLRAARGCGVVSQGVAGHRTAGVCCSSAHCRKRPQVVARQH